MRRSQCNRLPGVTSRFTRQASVPGYIKTSLVRARTGLDASETVRQMAQDMREAAFREGGLTREGLELLGYSSAQIDTHAAAARAMANRQAVLT